MILVLAGATVTAILEIGLINVSYAQVTPGQNPIYNPSDTHIDGTESRTCGVPKTPSLSSANTTTTTAEVTIPTTTGSPKQISPSSPSPPSITPPSENTTTTTLQGAIPGLLP